MDTDQDPPAPNGPKELNFEHAQRKVYLVKVPTNIAAQWASCGSDEQIGTLVFPADPSKMPAFYEYHQTTNPQPLHSRSVAHQMCIISEADQKFAIEGEVSQLYELKPKSEAANRKPPPPPMDWSPTVIDVSTAAKLEQKERPNMAVSMEWAGGRAVDARGIADIFVERPKEEVVHDLIIMFQKQESYTFEDLNRVLQQPKPYLEGILREYAATVTVSGKRHYRLRPEFVNK